MLRPNYYQTPPGWENAESFTVDGVLYTHGVGASGPHGARNLAGKRQTSCVIAHTHTVAGVSYMPAHDGRLTFGMSTGCGVDCKTYAMEYSRDWGRFALGCGVVLGGVEAHWIPWLTGRDK